MSRGLGRIERAILALIEDKDAGKNGYAAENFGRRSLSTEKRAKAGADRGGAYCGGSCHAIACAQVSRSNRTEGR
jgi:hypothetical protein